MYRQRRRKLQRRRRTAVVAAFAAVLAVVVAVPALASASGVDNVLNQVGVSGGSGGSAGSGSDSTRAGVPPTYTPPLHGTNPHGQGTNAVIDLTPGTSNPYSSDPTKSGEEVVVGNSRGDQNSDGSYSGNVTLLYLFGNPIVQVTSDPSNNGETQHGPLQPLQTQLLDAICSNSNGQACITLLKMDSTSNSNSSTNAFEALGVHLGGSGGLNADVLTSNGNIQSTDTCQNSHGDSSAAHVTAGGNPVADALQGSTDSGACQGGAPTQSNSSTTLSLGGNGLPIPAQGCADGTANTVFDSLAPLLATVCGADDTNGSQTSAPYGVREALALFALINGDSPVLKVSGGDAESHAVAPAGNTTPTPGPGTGGTKGAGGKGGNKGGNGNGGGNGGNAGANGNGAGAGAAANNAAAGNGNLAFTGADLLTLAVIGGALILGGLALTTTAGRRHRQTV